MESSHVTVAAQTFSFTGVSLVIGFYSRTLAPEPLLLGGLTPMRPDHSATYRLTLITIKERNDAS